MTEKIPVKMKISTEATLAGLLLTRMESHSGKAFHLVSPEHNREISFGDWQLEIKFMALALMEQKFQKGDRIIIFSENPLDVITVELAAISLGGISIVFAAPPSEQALKAISQDTSPFKIVLSQKTYPAYESLLPREHCWFWEEEMQNFSAHYKTFYQQEQESIDEGALMAQLEMMALDVASEDGATIVYSEKSLRSSSPRGSLLTHQNLLWAMKSILLSLPIFEGDSFYSLNLALLNRLAGVYLPLFLGQSVYLFEGDNPLNLLNFHSPHLIFGFSQELGKLAIRLEEELNTGWPRGHLFRWGKKNTALMDHFLRNKPLGLWDKMGAFFFKRSVLSQAKKIVGPHLRLIFSWGEKLKRHQSILFQTLGIEVWEGYSMAEIPLVSLHNSREEKAHTLGRPVLGVEVAVGQKGEILISSAQVSPYYWGEDPTQPSSRDGAGRFHTGDQGELDEDGYLILKDKK